MLAVPPEAWCACNQAETLDHCGMSLCSKCFMMKAFSLLNRSSVCSNENRTKLMLTFNLEQTNEELLAIKVPSAKTLCKVTEVSFRM
jgi:hypothetical protein